MRKNVNIFGTNMGSSVHIDNKNKDILILDEGPTQGLYETTLAVISLDSALKKDDNYYPQVYLKECIYIEKK